MNTSWVRLTGALTLLGTLVACDLTARFDAESRTHLEAALAHVAATDETRAGIEFGYAEAITALMATDDPKDVWGQLYGFGAGNLAPHTKSLWDVAGIDLRSARYLLTAGVAPTTAGLIEGGQNERRIRTRLEANGWHRLGFGYAAPPQLPERDDAAMLALPFGNMRLTGDNVVYAPASGSITPIVKPTERTLAKDAEFRPLASCLGDVLAARIVRGPAAGDKAPRLVGVGVRRATDRTSVPRAVICTTWASDGAADAAVGRQRDALRDGRGLGGRLYGDAYLNPTVSRIDGKGSLVRAEADTPTGAAIVLAAVDRHDLPGLATP